MIFFLKRYNQAYIDETIEFCKSLTNNTPPPVSGKDGLCSLVMALAADKSAEENRWVKFKEIIDEAKNVNTIEKLRHIHPAWVDHRTEKSPTPKSIPDQLEGIFASQRRGSSIIVEDISSSM